jgi:hypothetical protein
MGGIGENVLARVESVRAFGWKRLRWLAARAGLGFRAFHIEQRKVVD